MTNEYIWTNERTCSACFKLWWTMKSSSWNGLDYNETLIANAQIAILLIRRYAVGDPDTQGGGGRSHPDPEIRSGQSPKKIFSALCASVWSKNKGGAPPASPLDPPLVCFFNDDKIRLDVRESKIVLDSGFYVVDSDARCWTPDLCQWALDSGIPILRGIPGF